MLPGHYPGSSLVRAHPPPSDLRSHFPVLPVIGPIFLRRFLAGARRASPVAQSVLVTMPPLPPRRSEPVASASLRLVMLPSPSSCGLGLRDFTLSGPPMRSLSLQPGDSLTIPRMALSMGFKSSVSLRSAIRATALLALAPVGLTPTEHSSLRWTHNRTCGSPASGSRRRFTRSHAAGGRDPIVVEAARRFAPATDSSTSTARTCGSCVWHPTTCGTDTGHVR